MLDYLIEANDLKKFFFRRKEFFTEEHIQLIKDLIDPTYPYSEDILKSKKPFLYEVYLAIITRCLICM